MWSNKDLSKRTDYLMNSQLFLISKGRILENSKSLMKRFLMKRQKESLKEHLKKNPLLKI